MRFIDTHQDPWHLVCGEDGPVPHPAAQDHRLLTVEQWHAVREGWPAGLPTALLLPNTLDVETLHADLRTHAAQIALLVLQFPKWTDGRAYSQAHVLRSRLQYRRPLRATGDVVVDMLPLLQRTGFDEVQLRAGQSVASAQKALGFFGGHYQGDVVQAQPAFARAPA